MLQPQGKASPPDVLKHVKRRQQQVAGYWLRLSGGWVPQIGLQLGCAVFVYVQQVLHSLSSNPSSLGPLFPYSDSRRERHNVSLAYLQEVSTLLVMSLHALSFLVLFVAVRSQLDICTFIPLSQHPLCEEPDGMASSASVRVMVFL